MLAVAVSERLAHQLALVWGVVPLMIKGALDASSSLAAARPWLTKRALARAGEPLVVVASPPGQAKGLTYSIQVADV